MKLWRAREAGLIDGRTMGRMLAHPGAGRHTYDRATRVTLRLVKVVDRLLIHGTLIGLVALIGLAVLGRAACVAEFGGIRTQRREGAAWASGHSWSSCVTEAIRRSGRGEGDPNDTAQKQAFLSACLSLVAEPPGACDDVQGLMGSPTRSGVWAQDVCADAGARNEWNCQALLFILRAECDRRHPPDGG